MPSQHPSWVACPGPCPVWSQGGDLCIGCKASRGQVGAHLSLVLLLILCQLKWVGSGHDRVGRGHQIGGFGFELYSKSCILT